MKKLSLVLALILVFTCFAFVACGDDTDTSSAASSAASSDASSAASSDASSAASSDASSEASSDASADESADASADESADASADESADESTGDTTPGQAAEGTGTNVALNKPYTGGDEAAAQPGYNANLTDGQASNVGAYDATWFGFYYNAGSATPSNNAPNGVGTVVVDLGAKTDNINAIKVNCYNCNASGIVPADSIVAYISENGTDYTEVGALVLPEGDDPAWASIAVNNASAQYVKLVFTIPGTWTFINEIEVYA